MVRILIYLSNIFRTNFGEIFLIHFIPLFVLLLLADSQMSEYKPKKKTN